MKKQFDAIVVGAGHAGVEAALVLARKGQNTLLMTLSLNAVAFMACNPNIGGTAKGHIVKEIDALGGAMGEIADKATIQTRLLNLANGAAVHSLRNQVDKDYYHRLMKKKIETTANLTIIESEVSDILVSLGKVIGLTTTLGDTYYATAIVLATGVYLNSLVIIGSTSIESGPCGYARAAHLTKSLQNLGIDIRRFKTGTPPRVLASSVDFSQMEPQYGDKGIPKFSSLTAGEVRNDYPCYLTYTNLDTHNIILNNLDKAPLYNGSIKGVGPRYCPSIEDKVVRFKDKDRHQIFIEPEGADTEEMYIQGLSSSMPFYIQEAMVHTIKGLEHAQLTRYAYAIEYDCINPQNLLPTLALKNIRGLYAAGQINGSSGYEEAAGQGLVAGINAALYIMGQPPLILKRDEAYIGVLIDDLVTKGTNEPYRMMTSRAEHRLHLRQDNADIRLTEIGRSLGIVDDLRYQLFLQRKEEILKINQLLEKSYNKSIVSDIFLQKEESVPKNSISAREILKRSNLNSADLQALDKEFAQFETENLRHVEIELKYAGYLDKQHKQIKETSKLEDKLLSADFDYTDITGLRIEAAQKLNKIKPLTLAQAGRISGVNPADITVIMLYLRKNSH